MAEPAAEYAAAEPSGESAADARAVIFYDGHCGLCHRWVKFVIPRDPGGEKFVFSPLQGELIRGKLDEPTIAELPDSIVLLEPDGTLRTKSDAVLAILRRLGGLWGGCAAVGRIVPRFLRDACYDGVAKVRHRLFKKPDDACPLMPPELRTRFVF